MFFDDDLLLAVKALNRRRFLKINKEQHILSFEFSRGLVECERSKSERGQLQPGDSRLKSNPLIKVNFAHMRTPIRGKKDLVCSSSPGPPVDDERERPAGFHCCPLSSNSEINLTQISLQAGGRRDGRDGGRGG